MWERGKINKDGKFLEKSIFHFIFFHLSSYSPKSIQKKKKNFLIRWKWGLKSCHYLTRKPYTIGIRKQTKKPHSITVAFISQSWGSFLILFFKNMVWFTVSVKLHNQSFLMVWWGFNLSSEVSLTSGHCSLRCHLSPALLIIWGLCLHVVPGPMPGWTLRTLLQIRIIIISSETLVRLSFS